MPTHDAQAVERDLGGYILECKQVMRVILPRRFRARDVPVVIAREVSAEHSRIHLDVPLGQSRFRSCKPAKNSHAGLHHEVGISIQRSRRLVCPRRDPDLIALHRHGQARLQTRERIHPTLPIVRPARTLPHIDDPHVILRGIQIGNLRRTQGAVVDANVVDISFKTFGRLLETSYP